MNYTWDALSAFMLHQIATQPWGALYPYPVPVFMFDYRNELITNMRNSYVGNMAVRNGRTAAQVYQDEVNYFYKLVNQRIAAVNKANANATAPSASSLLPSWVQPAWATGFGIIGQALAGPVGAAIGGTVGGSIVGSGLANTQASLNAAAAAARNAPAVDPALNQALSSGSAGVEGSADGAMAGAGAGPAKVGLIPRFENWLYFPEAAAFYGNLNRLATGRS